MKEPPFIDFDGDLIIKEANEAKNNLRDEFINHNKKGFSTRKKPLIIMIFES